MEEHERDNWTESEQQKFSNQANRWLIGLVIVLLAATAVSFGYGYRQHSTVNQLTGQDQQLSMTVSQIRAQLDAVSAKLAQESAPPAKELKLAPQRSVTARRRAARSRTLVARRKPVVNHWKLLQTRLDDQQKQLKETQDEVAKTRADLEENLSSTRDELNGSIAKNHDELVALEKRGERSYYEFDLRKTKNFQQVGPIELSLRKANTKHKSYNLQMLVDDNTLTKKNVDLYEPIWIHEEGDAQPLQIVVNRIEKNRVHGYLSAPKYRQAEQASASGNANGLTPSPTSAVPVSAPASNTPSQSPIPH